MRSLKVAALFLFYGSTLAFAQESPPGDCIPVSRGFFQFQHAQVQLNPLNRRIAFGRIPPRHSYLGEAVVPAAGGSLARFVGDYSDPEHLSMGFTNFLGSQLQLTLPRAGGVSGTVTVSATELQQFLSSGQSSVRSPVTFNAEDFARACVYEVAASLAWARDVNRLWLGDVYLHVRGLESNGVFGFRIMASARTAPSEPAGSIGESISSGVAAGAAK